MMPTISMHRPLPLLAISAFAPIISVLANRSVRYVTGPGNTGDKLVHAGALCLFRQINTRVVDELEQSDFLAWGGGGNLGSFWPNSYERRRREIEQAVRNNIPIVIMPQSAPTTEETFP